MKVKDLIKELQKLDPEFEVLIADREYGDIKITEVEVWDFIKEVVLV